MEFEDKSKKKKTIIWIVVLGVVVLVLAGLLIWQIMALKAAKKAKDSATATVTVTASLTNIATKTATKTASATATSVTSTQDEIFGQVDTAVNHFLTAYVNRSLDEAKPYMTADYYTTLDQNTFAGASSPSRDHYEIIDTMAGADRYQVKAKVYLKLNGADSGTESWIVDVFPQDQNTYLVMGMNSASF